MNKKTLKALRGSIEKWEAIADGTGAEDGHRNCPLCKLFIDDGCAGCPVRAATGAVSCCKSPYDRWRNMPERNICVTADGFVAASDRAKEIARDEENFLRSLWPALEGAEA